MYIGASQDYSNEVGSGGKSVDVTALASVSVGDYTKNTDFSGGVLTDSKDTINLDKQKAWRINIDDIDAFQSRPNIGAEGIRKAGVALGNQVDRDIAAGLD